MNASEATIRSTIEAMPDEELLRRYKNEMFSDLAAPFALSELQRRGIGLDEAAEKRREVEIAAQVAGEKSARGVAYETTLLSLGVGGAAAAAGATGLGFLPVIIVGIGAWVPLKPFVKWVAARVENPILRFAAGAGLTTAMIAVGAILGSMLRIALSHMPVS